MVARATYPAKAFNGPCRFHSLLHHRPCCVDCHVSSACYGLGPSVWGVPIVATPTQVKSLLRENVCADAADAARLMLVLPLLAIPELNLLLACS